MRSRRRTLSNMKPSGHTLARPISLAISVGFFLCISGFTLIASWNRSLATPVSAPDQNLVLGILEDVPGHYAGQSDTRAVRLVFQKQGANWQAFPSECSNQQCLKTLPSKYPYETAWTITFRGKTLGKLSSRDRKAFDFYSDVGLQDIVSSGSVPTIGKKSEEYGAALGSAVYRPLVAISQPFSGDPADWRPADLPSGLISDVRSEFRRTFPRATNCKNPEENVARPWTYRDQDITFNRVYASREHWFLAQVLLTPNRCDGPPGDEFVNQWFAIAPSKEIKFLGKAMWLVDAGDYDNDGKSEVVFSIAGEDVGGYELFYDNFIKHATFEFSYH
jgi:hypothetical protein